jgi:hypothetical protein
MERLEQRGARINRMQVAVIGLWFATLIFRQFSYERGTLVLTHLVEPALLMLAGAWFFRRREKMGTAQLLLAGFVVWYIFTRIANGDHYLKTDFSTACQIIGVFFVAFPLAAEMDDRARDRALVAAASLVVTALAALAWAAVGAAVVGKPITSPWNDAVLGINDYFGGPLRLNVLNWHPNISAAMFAFGVGLSLFLMARLKRVRWIAPVALAMLGLYAAIALTLSRGGMVTVSLELGGFAALLFARKARVKRPLGKAAAIAGVMAVTTLLMFLGLTVSIDGMSRLADAISHNETSSAVPTIFASVEEAAVEDDSTAAAEASASLVDTERLSQSLDSFSGRLDVIYPEVVPVLAERPVTLLIGNPTNQVVKALNQLTDIHIYHWHNVFLQTLMTAGLPAMLCALGFSALLIVRCARLVFNRRTLFALQVLVLPVAGLFLHSMIEDFLFTNTEPNNLLFFLIAGFLFAFAPSGKKKQTAERG